MTKAMLKTAAACLLALSLAACSANGQSQSSSQKEGEPSYRIGVIQLLEHDALDDAYKGFLDGLRDAGLEEGKNLTIDYQNAQNDQSNCVTIAQKFSNDRPDLILAIATPAAQAVANATQTIPIVITAITDPADAKLVESNEAPGTNVTGTSDLAPIGKQFDLLRELVPDAKTVGLLYCTNEANSTFQIEIAKQEAKRLGLAVVEATVSSSNEIQQVTQSLVGKADVIYVPTDNTMAGGIATVAQVTESAGVPVIAGEPKLVEGGCLATVGISYYDIGKQAAAQAAAILLEGKDPAGMPIEYAAQTHFYCNEENAKALGITIPADLLAQKAAQ